MGSLTDFYENILKKACAGGRPVAMPLSKFVACGESQAPGPQPVAMGSLTDFYENILKKACAGGRPVAMPLSKFVTKAASLPAPDTAAGADGNDNNVVVPRADSDTAAPPPGPEAAETAAAPPAPAAPPTPPRGRRAGRGGGKPKTS